MWRACHHRLASAALAILMGIVTSNGLAQISISPIVIEIDEPRRAVAVSVVNDSERPITIQSEVLLWQQKDGVDHYEPSDALLVVPSIAQIPAKSSQVIRVLLRSRAPSLRERTYRLVLEDITEEQAATGSASVSFKFTHSLPVMIAPSGKIQNSMRWKPCVDTFAPPPQLGTLPLKEACVRLLNTGNRRIKVQSMTLSGDGWQQSLSLKGGENVLAGSEREWRVALQPGQNGALRGVQVHTALGETLLVESGGF